MSIGRAGNNLHASPEQLKKDGGIIHFDCRDNIKQTIAEFGHLFEEIVVSTWDNEVQPGESFKGARLISVPDPGGIKQVGHYKDNNKHRQFISTLNGLNELEKNGMDYAVKMRTDSHVDLKTLLSSFFSHLEHSHNHRAIGATVVHGPTFLLHDLYFVAELPVLKEFCESIEAYDQFEFISSVHREMVLKHAYYSYKDEIDVPDWAYFPLAPGTGVCADTRKIFDYMFSHVYFSLNPKIFRETLWRGACYEKEHVDRLVVEDYIRKYNIPALIAIDWKRYYHFRAEQSGLRPSLGDKTKIVIGQWGWASWEFTKKVVRMVR